MDPYPPKVYAPQRTVVYKREALRSGVGFGTALAIAISWSKNGSILWAVIHGLMSWLYVIYYAIT